MIAEALYTILSTDATLAAIVADRIYPIIDIPDDPNTAGYNLSAIYYSVQMRPEYSKNRPIANNHTITFLTVANGYLSAWNIALALRDALVGKTTTVKDKLFRLDRCSSLEDEYEFTPVNMYGQKVVFNIRTAYY